MLSNKAHINNNNGPEIGPREPRGQLITAPNIQERRIAIEVPVGSPRASIFQAFWQAGQNIWIFFLHNKMKYYVFETFSYELIS